MITVILANSSSNRFGVFVFLFTAPGILYLCCSRATHRGRISPVITPRARCQIAAAIIAAPTTTETASGGQHIYQHIPPISLSHAEKRGGKAVASALLASPAMRPQHITHTQTQTHTQKTPHNFLPSRRESRANRHVYIVCTCLCCPLLPRSSTHKHTRTQGLAETA